MVRIRTETPDDRTDVQQILEAAFETDYEARLVDRLRKRPAFVPSLSLVAEDGGEPVGYALATRVSVGGDATGLGLGPVGVVPDRQGEGIGSALVRTALERARDRGADLVVLVGDPEYYGRFGFETAATLGLRTDQFDVADEYFQVRTLADDVADRARGAVAFDDAFLEP